MRKILVASLVLGVGLVVQASAATISWGAAVDNGLSVEGGSQLPQQNLIRLGYFDASDATILSQSTNIATLNQSFTEVATARVGDGVSMSGQFTKSSNVNAAALVGRQIYFWAFASTNNATVQSSIDTAFQIGVYYLDKAVDGSWSFPAEEELFTAVDLTDLTDESGLTLVNGAHVVVGNFPDGTSFSGEPNFGLAVPEPSTLGLVIVGLLGLNHRRRLS